MTWNCPRWSRLRGSSGVISLLLLLLSATPSGEKAINLRVSPRHGFEPLTVRATIVIEPNDLNTEWCLSWDSDDGEAGGTCRTMEGQYASKTTEILVERLPAGTYRFQASVNSRVRINRTAVVDVNVICSHC